MTTTTETAPADTTDAGTLLELIAEQLSSMHVIDGHLLQLEATAQEDCVWVDLSCPFPPESHLRVVLIPSYPAEITGDGVEIGASA